MKRPILSLVFAILAAAAVQAQPSFDPSVRWTVTSRQLDNVAWELVFSGNIARGMHIYDTHNPYNATTVEFTEIKGATLVGDLYEAAETRTFDGQEGFEGKALFGQAFRLTAKDATIKGTLTWSACDDRACGAPEDYDFTVTVHSDTMPPVIEDDFPPDALPPDLGAGVDEMHATPIDDPEAGATSKGLWGLILEAVLWGFAMLLTPCVFPMVPMTVSFFLKGSGSPAAGRFKAFMYGLFIILLYTVPISLIILATWLFGGNAVTADIFNWLATHWLPNLIFFAVFMIFAASFFGAFEITLPSSLVNKSDAKSDKKGLAGIFFMALTLVLVSFSCTGPIVGSVLIKSTQGEFWTPMVTMLAFSTAFALPFTILALFPSLLKKMKQSNGGWLNSVKVVLGFIEIALGFKFLSTADQTYHWGLLDREIYLAIWIVTFTLLGFYLLGKIRFRHDEPVERIGVLRLSLAIAVFSFVVYLIPGMVGAPLKALSGYLPPIETQDFIIANYAEGQSGRTENTPEKDGTAARFNLALPHHLDGYFTLEEGLAAAKETGKPVFLDITGHGCVNCREMEARVWSDPRVLQRLRDDFIVVALYTDDKSKLSESEWVTTDSGKVLKDFGRVNSYIARTRFGVNAQPNYFLLDPDGNVLAGPRGYNLDADAFVRFLDSAR